MQPRETYCNYCLRVIESAAAQIIHGPNAYHSACWRKKVLVVMCRLHQRVQYQKKWIAVGKNLSLCLQRQRDFAEIVYQKCDKCSKEEQVHETMLISST